MNHELAVKIDAVDKYLMNELTGAERHDFEEHMFDCPACFGLVERDALIVDNLKEVLREPLPDQKRSFSSVFAQWTRPFVFIPSFAALALAMFTGYQNLVYIPGLNKPMVLQPHVIDSVARGVGTAIHLDRGAAMFNLSFDVDSPQAYASYVCEFQNDRKETVLTVDAGQPATAAFTLNLLLPAKKFPAGQYVAIISAGAQNTEVRRLPFLIQN
jgi:putative zinc finger protein